MSKKTTMIEIAPPDRTRKEVFTTEAVACPYCGGRGGFPTRDVHGARQEQCPDCQGYGVVRAVVTVDWTPAVGYRLKNINGHENGN